MLTTKWIYHNSTSDQWFSIPINVTQVVRPAIVVKWNFRAFFYSSGIILTSVFLFLTEKIVLIKLHICVAGYHLRLFDSSTNPKFELSRFSTIALYCSRTHNTTIWWKALLRVQETYFFIGYFCSKSTLDATPSLILVRNSKKKPCCLAGLYRNKHMILSALSFLPSPNQEKKEMKIMRIYQEILQMSVAI